MYYVSTIGRGQSAIAAARKEQLVVGVEKAIHPEST